MRTQGLGRGTWAGVGALAVWFAACAGDDIPDIDNDLRDDVAAAFPDDQPGAAGAANAGGGAAGDGGAAGSSPVTAGGNGGDGGSGEDAVGNAGSGGAAPSGGGGDVCNAFEQVFIVACADGGCHAEAGAPIGDFALSEEAGAALVDQVSSRGEGCGLLIDSSNTEESLILKMVEGTQDPGACFPLPMPLNGDDLSAADVECVEDWLTQFAE